MAATIDLIVEPTAGLGNRLRVLFSALALSRRLDRPLQLIWTRTPDLGCRFRDLFETPPGVVVRESAWTTSRLRRRLGRALGRYDRLIAQGEVERLLRDGYDFGDLRRFRRPFLITCTRFFPGDGVLGHLVPVKEVLQSVEGGTARMTSHTVGVHVRRGDNPAAAARSPTVAFIERMARETALDPRTDFFLATDSMADQAVISQAFPGRVTSLPKSLDRSRPEAVRAALVDLLCLARTRLILGSHWSSFSEAAAEIGRKPLEVVQASG